MRARIPIAVCVLAILTVINIDKEEPGRQVQLEQIEKEVAAFGKKKQSVSGSVPKWLLQCLAMEIQNKRAASDGG